MAIKDQTLYLSLTAISTSTKAPIYKVRVNGVEHTPITISDIEPFKQQINYCVTSPYINTIEIELLNKGPTDTVVADGKIVEDLLLIVESISIDCINLLNNLGKISVYKDTTGQVHRTFNYITFNGIMTIKIHKNPIYTQWLANLV